MSNTLTPLIQTILARGLIVLRRTCIMPQLVNMGYSLAPLQKGKTVSVNYSKKRDAYDITASSTPLAPADNVMASVDITLDKWKGSNFHLTDQEMTQIMVTKDFLPLQTEESAKAISKACNDDIFALYKMVYGYTGTAATTPFSNATDRTATKDATNLRKVLNSQLCPRDMRSAVLNADAEAEALALPQFSNLSQSGDPNVLRLGSLGLKYGFNWFCDEDVPTHTAGTPGGTPLVSGAHTAAAADRTDTLSVKGMTATTGDYHAGDIITIAGHTQTYVVLTLATADGSGNIAALSISPGLQTALSGDEAITLKASHVVNMGFNKNAFAFASAPLDDSGVIVPNTIVESLRDPVSGLVLRLEITRERKQTVWEFDILYGTQCIRPECASRLAG